MVRKSRTKDQTSVSIVRTPANTAITIPSSRMSNAAVRTVQLDQRRTRRSRHNGPPQAAVPYINTLNDPFQYGAIRLGWGTMVSTSVGTCFQRATAQTNADGSFTLLVEPQLGGSVTNLPIQLNVNAYSTGGAWAKTSWSNANAFAPLAGAIRTVSIGLKVMPLVPATAVPGVLYSGAVSGTMFGYLSGYSTSTIVASPYLQPSYGAQGVIATGRPIDPSSFQFIESTAIGVPSASFISCPFSVPVVAGSGFPANTTIVYEAVWNFEYTDTLNFSATAASTSVEGGRGSNDRSLLSRVYNNVESMWNAVKGYLNPTSVVGVIGDMMRIGYQGSQRALMSMPSRPGLPAVQAVSNPSHDDSRDESVVDSMEPPRVRPIPSPPNPSPDPLTRGVRRPF